MRRDDLKPWLRWMPKWCLRSYLVVMVVPVTAIAIYMNIRDEVLPEVVREWYAIGRIDDN